MIEQRLAELVSDFARYVEAYDQLVPFTGTQLATHRQTIDLRRQAGSVRAAIGDPRFVASLRSTLRAWGVGVRAGRLVPETAFVEALVSAAPKLEALENLRIDGTDLPANLAGHLGEMILSLGVVENQAKIVAGTKTLHHLLPDLVVPMDRAWTGKFFGFNLPDWQDTTSQRRIFALAYESFLQVARQVQPEQYVTGEGWRTSRTKILDNALIGFCKVELDMEPFTTPPLLPQLAFNVSGYPPIKNEAISMFSAAHGQAEQVASLLRAAQSACAAERFVPIAEGSVGIEVVLHTPVHPPGDATNYLGGIADSLQDKAASRVPLDHLGDLANVHLYANDKQIAQVTYREEPAAEAGYTVTVSTLGDGMPSGEGMASDPAKEPTIADETHEVAPPAEEPPLHVSSYAPPGWHTDPYRQARLRWWDGTQWTGHTAS